MNQRRQLWIVTIIALILVGVSVYLGGRDSAREAETVSVRVEGAVRQPGSIVLVNGMRVIDAIEACGGILPDAKMEGVDVSAELTEGQVIRVASAQVTMAAEEEEASEEEKSSSKPPKKKKAKAKAEPANMTSGSLNINTASARQLERLPGIGPVLAGAIVEYRKANGRFETIADIQRVKGIGKKKYEKMKPFIRTE